MGRRKSAQQLWDAAFASLEAAAAQSRLEHAASDARIAQLRLAAELEQLGRQKEAARIIAQVRREQEREFGAYAEVESKIEQHVAEKEERQ